MGAFLVLGLLAALGVDRDGFSSSQANEPAAEGFTPVAPAVAIHAALQSNLKIVRGWLDEKDYLSAAQSTQGLLALVHLYSHQSSEPRWREKTAALREAFGRLLAATMAKDAPGCLKIVQECDALLAELAQNLPQGARTVDRDFRPGSTTRTWMQLLDGTYADAKSADNAQELEHLAYTIAEGSNAIQFLRTDSPWRLKAVATRQAAVEAAAQARTGGLKPAREALKAVFNRCQECHETLKR